ncbi:MAG: hypothetical protein WA705_18285 [Candidatus Ozemobacteraceae bacterium]
MDLRLLPAPPWSVSPQFLAMGLGAILLSSSHECGGASWAWRVLLSTNVRADAAPSTIFASCTSASCPSSLFGLTRPLTKLFASGRHARSVSGIAVEAFTVISFAGVLPLSDSSVRR